MMFGNLISATTAADILTKFTILSTVSTMILHPVTPGEMAFMPYAAP